MNKKNFTLINEEVPFEFRELFVSMTDKRGVIIAGNDVFERVSGYSREQLIGSPHSLVRHPDMPKCVFKLLWATIEKGEGICAYVKNRSSDGRYYWVLASMIPNESGYLSIRLKPSSDLFAPIVDLYANVLKEEGRYGVDKGTEALLDGIRKLGFSNYTDFMTEALFREVRARDEKISKAPSEYSGRENALRLKPSRFELTIDAIQRATAKGAADFVRSYERIHDLKDLVVLFSGHTEKIIRACRKLENLSMNMNVSANKLGQDGLSLSVVAQAFQRSANEVIGRFDRFASLIQESSNSVRGSRFSLAITRLQAEMLASYAREAAARSFAANEKSSHLEQKRFVLEFALILEAVKGSFSQVIAKQRTALDHLQQFYSMSDTLRSVVLGLDLIRLGGRLEGSRTDRSDAAFKPYTDEMVHFIEAVERPILEINTVTSEFLQVFNELQSSLEVASIRLIEVELLETRMPKLESKTTSVVRTEAC